MSVSLTAIDQLRLYVHDADTFTVTLDDIAENLVAEIDALSAASAVRSEGVTEPEAVALLRGPLSKRSTSAEFNEWQARDVVEYIDRLTSPVQTREALTREILAWVREDVLPAYGIFSETADPELAEGCAAAIDAALNPSRKETI
jgi:hypothetical protein